MTAIKVALPGPRVPICDPATGLMNPAWYQALQAFFLRAGGSAVDKIEVAAQSGEAAAGAAASAEASAVAAQNAANAAQGSVDTSNALQVLVNSGTGAVTITGHDAGFDASIAITAHPRYYANGTSVAVNSGSAVGLTYSTPYYVYYDDASRAGGAVTYHASDDPADAQPTPAFPDRHYVGSVTTPAVLGADTTGQPNFYA